MALAVLMTESYVFHPNIIGYQHKKIMGIILDSDLILAQTSYIIFTILLKFIQIVNGTDRINYSRLAFTGLLFMSRNLFLMSMYKSISSLNNCGDSLVTEAIASLCK